MTSLLSIPTALLMLRPLLYPQIELARGHITHEAIHYIIYPSPGSKFAVKGLIAQAGMDLREATPVNFGKRPYDWILEAQWQNMMVSVD